MTRFLLKMRGKNEKYTTLACIITDSYYIVRGIILRKYEVEEAKFQIGIKKPRTEVRGLKRMFSYRAFLASSTTEAKAAGS